MVTARHLLGWTQAQLAERIGYSRRAVVTLEAGGPLDPVMALAMKALLILPEPPVAIPATAPETAFDQGAAGEQP